MAVVSSQPKNTPNSLLEKYFEGVDRMMVTQELEEIETATACLSLGCCKVETENKYLVKVVEGEKVITILMAEEYSNWFMRNPCLCCDCVCWCFHSNCSSRRSFIMQLTTPDPDLTLVLEMSRPCASDCLPCCLQSISVRDKTGDLGTVQQTTNCVLPCTMCGLFEVSNKNKEVIYLISTPCVLTSCCNGGVVFTITDTEEREVGEIIKIANAKDLAREGFTDADRFYINFPENCITDMKPVLLGAVFLLDYLFYED